MVSDKPGAIQTTEPAKLGNFDLPVLGKFEVPMTNARDDVWIVDKVLKEAVPVLRGSPRIAKHVAQFFNAMGGDNRAVTLQERVQTFPDLSGARLLREIRELEFANT